MRLFGFIEDRLCDVVDAFEKGFDTFANAADTILDKAGDIRYTAESAFISAEGYTKDIINDAKYIAKTKDFEEIKTVAHSINEFKKTMMDAKLEITEDMKVIIRNYNTLADKVKFVKSFFNISDEEAKELLKEYGLRDIQSWK